MERIRCRPPCVRPCFAGVTGIASRSPLFAVCVGLDLCWFDVRKMPEPLGEVRGAFDAAYTSGIYVDEEARKIVTASPDGCVKLWAFA